MCEVVIHDFRYPEKSLVYIAGKLTDRKLGAPITNIVLEALKKNGDKSSNLIGYQTVTKDNKMLKCSTIFIKDDEQKIIGCMCINLNITELITCQEIIENFTRGGKANQSIGQEEFFGDVNEALDSIIEKVLNNYPTPRQLMEKEDKLHIVRELDEKGVFLVKGAVEQVASVLGVSRYTIYNYLEEVRSRTHQIIS